jgi:hypothetical protein
MPEAQSLEDYCAISPSLALELMTLFPGYDNDTAIATLCHTRESPPMLYDLYRQTVLALYYLRSDEKITKLVTAFHALDTGCGIEEELRPDTPFQETQRLLRLLDEDLLLFGKIYRQHREGMTDPHRTLFTQFSRLIFRFNGYQAPPRSDPEQAMRDALGLTDLFSELFFA